MTKKPRHDPDCDASTDGFTSDFRQRAPVLLATDLLDALPTACLLAKTNGTLVYANPEAAALLGFESVAQLLHSSSACTWSLIEAFATPWWQSILDRPNKAVSSSLRQANGQCLQTLVRLAPAPDSNSGLLLAHISERSKTAEQFQQLQERYEALLRRSIDLEFKLALFPQPHFNQLSESALPLLGYAPGELLADGDALERIVHSEDRSNLLDPNAGEATPVGIVRFLHRDGRFLWMRVQKTCTRNARGELEIEGSARDVTRELEQDQALEESVELLRSIIDHAPVIVWSIDRKGKFELSEGRGLENLGLAPGQIVGQSIWDLYAEHPQIIEATRVALRGEPVDGTWDLGPIQFDFHYAPNFDRNGHPSGATGVAVDVTRRHRAEHENQRLLTAIEQATEAVVLTDRSGCVTYVNPAYDKTSGYDRDKALEKPWKNLEIATDQEFLKRLEVVLTEGLAWSGRTKSRRATGASYDEDVTLSPIRDPMGIIQGAVAVKRDITDQLRWEEQLRQSQKMEAVGQLAGGIAHDFNNLLQIIRGNLELLSNQPLEEYPQHLADDISHATDRAVKLVRQLLAFSRKDSVEFVTLRLDRVIFALLGMLRRLLGEDIEVDWLTASGLPYIRANAPQLEQIVVNLCVNARDAMPRGGRLQLKVSSEPLPPALASIHATSGEDRFAVLSVEDDGEGMSPEVRDRIFEPFFTTKGVGKGTGLGLATVYAIMERHGGFIDVLSAPGQGTSFRLYFPAVEGQESGSGTFKASRTVEGRNRLVLVAEDDPQIRNLTARFLARAGFRVVTAMDGAEADALISKNAEELSLVILDAIMPHLRGPDVYLRMRARGSMVPCLIVTGYDFQSLDPIPELVRAMVLQKPFDGQQLFDRLAQLLEDT